MMRSGAEINASENQSKFMQDRISTVEKHFGDICQGFAGYVRNLAKLRDKGDQVAKSVMTYANIETINVSTKTALSQFASNFSAIQDYRNAEIERIETKVIHPLTLYGTSCKKAKDRLKTSFTAHNKEVRQMREYNRLQMTNPNATTELTRAQSQFQRASVDAERANQDLQAEMDKFEKKKLEDIKMTMGEFVNVELLFHAKAIEMYTQCYLSLSALSEDDDLQQFRASLLPPATVIRTTLQLGLAPPVTGQSAYNNAGLALPNPGPGRTGPPTNRSDYNSTLNSNSMYSTQGDDDDDDEDDDDDDDDDNDDDDEDYEDESQITATEASSAPRPTPRGKQQQQPARRVQ